LKPKTTNFLFEKLHQLMQSQGYPKKGSQLEEKLQKNEVLLAWASDRREAERKEAQWKGLTYTHSVLADGHRLHCKGPEARQVGPHHASGTGNRLPKRFRIRDWSCS
jgi:hypothetical protein